MPFALDAASTQDVEETPVKVVRTSKRQRSQKRSKKELLASASPERIARAKRRLAERKKSLASGFASTQESINATPDDLCHSIKRRKRNTNTLTSPIATSESHNLPLTSNCSTEGSPVTPTPVRCNELPKKSLHLSRGTSSRNISETATFALERYSQSKEASPPVADSQDMAAAQEQGSHVTSSQGLWNRLVSYLKEHSLDADQYADTLHRTSENDPSWSSWFEKGDLDKLKSVVPPNTSTRQVRDALRKVAQKFMVSELLSKQDFVLLLRSPKQEDLELFWEEVKSQDDLEDSFEDEIQKGLIEVYYPAWMHQNMLEVLSTLQHDRDESENNGPSDRLGEVRLHEQDVHEPPDRAMRGSPASAKVSVSPNLASYGPLGLKVTEEISGVSADADKNEVTVVPRNMHHENENITHTPSAPPSSCLVEPIASFSNLSPILCRSSDEDSSLFHQQAIATDLSGEDSTDEAAFEESPPPLVIDTPNIDEERGRSFVEAKSIVTCDGEVTNDAPQIAVEVAADPQSQVEEDLVSVDVPATEEEIDSPRVGLTDAPQKSRVEDVARIPTTTEVPICPTETISSMPDLPSTSPQTIRGQNTMGSVSITRSPVRIYSMKRLCMPSPSKQRNLPQKAVSSTDLFIKETQEILEPETDADIVSNDPKDFDKAHSSDTNVADRPSDYDQAEMRNPSSTPISQSDPRRNKSTSDTQKRVSTSRKANKTPSKLAEGATKTKPHAQAVYRTGALSRREVLAVQAAVQKVMDEDGLPLEVICEMIHDRTRADKKKFWSRLIYCIPERRPKNMREYLRKAYKPTKHISQPWTDAEKLELRKFVGVHGHQWTKIGELLQRYREDCQQMYRRMTAKGDSPGGTKRGQWTAEEEALFARTIATSPEIDYDKIAQDLGTRTPRQVLQHARDLRILKRSSPGSPSLQRSIGAKAPRGRTRSSLAPAIVVPYKAMTPEDVLRFVEVLQTLNPVSLDELDLPSDLDEVDTFGYDQLCSQVNNLRKKIMHWRSMEVSETLEAMKRHLLNNMPNIESTSEAIANEDS